MRTCRKILRACVLVILLVHPAFTQNKNDTERSCREFVQAFYDWYVPKSLHGHNGPASDPALKYKRSLFSDELVRGLSEDSAAQAKSDEIVGLDFDPFLNSQDPSEHFVVRSVTRKGDRYWVEVRGVQSGKFRETVIPELVFTKEGRWQFVNFHYGKSEFFEDENLLRTLELLRQDREKGGKR